jgi:hypothetical protein
VNNQTSIVPEFSYRDASMIYKDQAGHQFHRPDKGLSYYRGGAWHLLDKDGALHAVVFADSLRCVFGPALLAWSRQLSAGMPAPRR